MDMSQILDTIKNHEFVQGILKYLFDNMFELILVVILLLGYKKIKKGILRIFEKILSKTFIENDGLKTFFMSILNIVVTVLYIYVILILLGINLTGIFAILGAASLVLGFAFKETLGNFFGGVILLTFKPFKVGDVIEYKGYTGTVQKIEIFYTTITNFQNEEVIVPNANVTSNEIRNINTNQHRRLDLTVGVGYDSNIEQVKALLLDMIMQRKDDLFYIEEVAPVIGMLNIGASALEFQLRVFVRPDQYLNAQFYLNETIKTVFDKNGIDLPYNIVDVNISK